MTQSSLLFITHEYPNVIGDTSFIKNEISYVSKNFSKVYVLCLTSKKDMITVPANVSVTFYTKKHSKMKKIGWLFSLLTSRIFYNEIRELSKNRKQSFKTLKTAVLFFLEALSIKNYIKKILKNDNSIKLIYTYWYTNETLASLILKEKYSIKCVTRTHRYDLYEFANKQNYQPYKQFMDKKIDKVFFISKHGYDYYLKTFVLLSRDLKHSSSEKYTIAYLGVLNETMQTTANNNNDFSLISCSFIHSVKRVHLIIESLAEIDNFNIRWVHIGDGQDMDYIACLANKLLSNKNNIMYKFTGLMTNDQIMKYYSENYFDCFISTSESEGLPVSMMEAISFGTPIIAVNVGGVSEIVNEDIGILLHPECAVSDIKNAVIDFYNFSIEKKNNMRKAARLLWETKFNESANFKSFSNKLIEVIHNDTE